MTCTLSLLAFFKPARLSCYSFGQATTKGRQVCLALASVSTHLWTTWMEIVVLLYDSCHEIVVIDVRPIVVVCFIVVAPTTRCSSDATEFGPIWSNQQVTSKSHPSHFLTMMLIIANQIHVTRMSGCCCPANRPCYYPTRKNANHLIIRGLDLRY